MQKKQSFGELLQASLKSKDTEETIDIYFNRPVGLAIALICKSMHIHPLVPEHNTAQAILHSIRSNRKFTDEEAKLLDTCLIVHAEHACADVYDI